MKKQANIEDENLIAIIPEYGRQKLLGYAESFRDLAELFEEKEETEECRQDTTRQEYLLQKKLCENQGLLADHLKEMAHIMADVAQETYRYRPVGERRYRQIARMLKESGIQPGHENRITGKYCNRRCSRFDFGSNEYANPGIQKRTSLYDERVERLSFSGRADLSYSDGSCKGSKRNRKNFRG